MVHLIKALKIPVALKNPIPISIIWGTDSIKQIPSSEFSSLFQLVNNFLAFCKGKVHPRTGHESPDVK
jgi:hypothetical protein